MGREVVLDVKHLKKYFPLHRGWIASLLEVRREPPQLKAVDDISFQIHRGETLGLAGESGCGKTTTVKVILKLYEATAGEIRFEGEDIRHLRGERLKAFRRQAQMIFQDPYQSFTPRFPIAYALMEPLIIHGIGNQQERQERVAQVLEMVHLSPPSRFLERYPHELSGGQLQRVALARALILEPKFLVADEPVTMLDVSIRAGVLNLLKEITVERKLASLYISHDLSLIKYMTDLTAIMYLGKIVEIGPTKEIIKNPLHPYTKALLKAVPVPDPSYRMPDLAIGDTIPSPINLPAGCHFADRCPECMPICRETPVKEISVGDRHQVFCHLYQ